MRNLLTETGKTQGELARELHISASAMSLKMNCKVAFTVSQIKRMAEIFSTTTDVLLGREPLEVA